MTLRKQTLLTIGAALIVLVPVFYLASSFILLDGFRKVEEKISEQNTRRVHNRIAEMIADLNSKAGDWANWDDLYNYTQTLDPVFIEVNPTDKAFMELKLDLMALVSTSGQILYVKAFDLEGEKEVQVPQGLWRHLPPDSLLFHHESPQSVINGTILLPEGPLLLASRPILTSQGKGPIQGTLIMGRYLDGTEIRQIAESTRIHVEIHRIDGPRFPLGKEALQALQYREKQILVNPVDGERVGGYMLIEDVYGAPALLLETHGPRCVHKQGILTMRSMFISLLALGIILGLVILVFLERRVLSRLEHLKSQIMTLFAGDQVSERLAVSGSDEISSFAEAVNERLGAMADCQDRLVELCKGLDQLSREPKEEPELANVALEAAMALQKWTEEAPVHQSPIAGSQR